jgi:hypothetical protein
VKAEEGLIFPKLKKKSFFVEKSEKYGYISCPLPPLG